MLIVVVWGRGEGTEVVRQIGYSVMKMSAAEGQEGEGGGLEGNDRTLTWR